MTPGTILTGNTYFFILIMIRYLGLFLLTPILSSRVIPTRVKVAFTFFLAVVTFPVLNHIGVIDFPDHVIIIVLAVVRELAIGLIIGFMTTLVFTAFQLAGQFIDMRMGFMMANVVDPMQGISSPLVGQFQYVLAALIFLSINGHHILIRALFQTYNVIPVGEALLSNGAWLLLFRKTGDIFLIALQISLPIIGTIFIVDIIFAFLARAIPQMNIFIVGFPIKILVGLLFLLLSIHVVVSFMGDTFQEMFRDILKMIKLLA